VGDRKAHIAEFDAVDAGHRYLVRLSDDDRLGEGSWMPAEKPPEFRRRAVELARQREKPIAQIA
jgi:hypothetical protein